MKPVTEEELAAKAVAPRVTLEQLEGNISSVTYLNVGDAICRTGQEDHQSHHLLTLCILVLRNGFTVVGESACASPENYDKEIGQRLAYEKAIEKVWMLMGYALRDHMTYGGQSFWAQPADPVKVRDWLDGDDRRNGVR